jgi:8-oxo-dGTP pyrophosphatase MutT (NUDIX family)
VLPTIGGISSRVTHFVVAYGRELRIVPTARMSKHKTRDEEQYAALPFRIDADGKIRVLLLTSRETKRWVIPKGWPMRGKKPREVAAQEAFEEAGLVGTLIGKRPVGNFHYAKEMAPGREILCRVKVFLLRVERQLDDWPERGQRETRWFGADDAAALVDEGGLAEIMRHSVCGRDATG